MTSLRLLMLSTPVGPLGSGLGGGVELTVTNLAQAMANRGHHVAIAAPKGSKMPLTPPVLVGSDGAPDSDDLASGQSSASTRRAATSSAGSAVQLVEIAGRWQPTAQEQTRSAPVLVESALANMWRYAHQVQDDYDLLLNFAYDWLPFYLTPWLSVPVAHFVSMASLSDRMDEAIAELATQYPGRLGAYTRSQAATFPIPSVGQPAWEILGSGLDLARYHFCHHPGPALGWAGRIAPEKGLEDAIAAASIAGLPLKIFGKIEDEEHYWQKITHLIAQSPIEIEYGGFLPTSQLQAQLGRCRALLMTPRWIEAFGIVAIEALACGVPVIAYSRGGPTEIVRSGQTGWLVPPDDIAAMGAAIQNIDQIDRWACRRQAEALYSLEAWGQRFEHWFEKILAA